MPETPQAGPPPKKDDRRAATTAAHQENSNLDSNSTTSGYDTLSARLETLPQAELDGWCDRHGIPVVSIDDSAAMEALVAGGASAWIATDYWCCDDAQMAFALQHATYLVTFDDWADARSDRLFARAVTLAALGERVIFAPVPHGAPVQLVAGRGR